MKKTISLILTMYAIVIHGQSVSASKIMYYLKSQNQIEISKDLTKQGFLFKKKNVEQNFIENSYSKNSPYGLEIFNITKNDELFCLVYKPVSKFYSTLKEKTLTPDFIYSYTTGNNKYYENSFMRIGINNEKGIISFFTKLN